MVSCGCFHLESLRQGERDGGKIGQAGFAIIKDIAFSNMLFATYIEYTPDTAKIAATRPAHREYLKGLFETNRLAISGPFTDDKAGLLVYNAETVEDVEAMLNADPFAKQGVFVKWDIRRWKVIFANPELFPR